jgi:hypothetical protein
MEEKKNITIANKDKYLNSSEIVDNFKKSYLSSLQIILDDEKFKEKTDTLPLLKSSVINKYEKMFAKREMLRQKMIDKHYRNNSTEPNAGDTGGITTKGKMTSSMNIKKAIPKSIQIRYIIIDNQLVNITLNSLEENNEINSKLTDPFSSYFMESNPKIRKKAIDQIINNIFVKQTLFQNNDNDENKDNISQSENSALPNIPSNVPLTKAKKKEVSSLKKDNMFCKDLEVLEKKYKLYSEHNAENHEKYKEAMNNFAEKCETHNITTLGQKIDFFVYLFSNDSSINPKVTDKKSSDKLSIYNQNLKLKNSKKNFRSTNLSVLSVRSGNKKIEARSRRSSALLYDIKQVYYYEVKSAFKLSDDIINNNINALEKYEKELTTKIKSFQLVNKNFESSEKLIDKLRMYLLNQEISSEKVILRDCNLTSDRFLYLLYKRYFDFSKIKHLNLSKNNLGDTGGAYVLYLVSKYGFNVEYLNIGYNSLGKNSCEYLIDSLSNNYLKVTCLSIGGNKLGDKAFSELSMGISKNLYLNKLFIGDNNLGKISAAVIGSILKYDKKLKLIDVSKNNFGDDIIGLMLKGLIVNTTLETLFLNDLGLTNRSFRSFATTLVINSTLKKLFLERNKLNYKATKALSDILNNNRHIEYISLVGNNFTHEHINYIIEQQRQIKLRVISKSDYFIQINSLGENANLYEYLE